MLTPLTQASDTDLIMVAYSLSYAVATKSDGGIRQGTWLFNCWGDLARAPFFQTVTAAYSEKISGYKDVRTLEMLKRGCCPPLLSELMTAPADPQVAKTDPIQAAISLHKKGYLGHLRDG